MHTTIRKEGVPKRDGEELGNGDPVDAVGGEQPELVPEAEPDALFPPIGKIDPDRPAHVGNAPIALGTEPTGREGHDQTGLGSNGDGPLLLRWAAGQIPRIGSKRLRRRETQDPKTNGWGAA